MLIQVLSREIKGMNFFHVYHDLITNHFYIFSVILRAYPNNDAYNEGCCRN